MWAFLHLLSLIHMYTQTQAYIPWSQNELNDPIITFSFVYS